MFYNRVLIDFFKSYWPFYPDEKQFRVAFIIERKRQYDCTKELKRVKEKPEKLINENNPALASNLLLSDYVLKPHDAKRVDDFLQVLQNNKVYNREDVISIAFPNFWWVAGCC